MLLLREEFALPSDRFPMTEGSGPVLCVEGAVLPATSRDTPKADRAGPLKQLRPAGRRLSLSRFGSRIAEWRALVRAVSRCGSVRITFRSGMSFFQQAVPALLLGSFFGKPVTVSYCSNKAEAELEDFGRGMQPFLKLAHRIEVPCDYTADVFRKYGVRVIVVPLVVDGALFVPRLVNSLQPCIVMARRLDRGNNVSGAIKAFRQVKQKYPRSELIIMGDGPQRCWLESWAETERIHGVSFLGQVSRAEVARQYARADIYLNSATLDGLPLSLLEALRAGLPVVSTAVGDIPSIVSDGVNALLTSDGDHSVLADRILELIEKPSLASALSAAAPEAAARFLGPEANS